MGSCFSAGDDLGPSADCAGDGARAQERTWCPEVKEAGLHGDESPARTGFVLDPSASPLPGFALVADAAVRHLSRRVGMDLWMVTQVDGDAQRVVAAHGAWVELARPETVFPLPESFCIRMLQGQAPSCAPDVRAVPAYAAAAVGALARVRCYVGVPLLRDDDALFGTLCGFAGAPRSDGLAEAFELVQFAGSMLSTVLAREAFALERSKEAAHAYTLAEVDELTGLRNRRGWLNGLDAESARCSRTGATTSILRIDLDEPPAADHSEDHAPANQRVRRCATVLSSVFRPTDVVARPAGDEFVVIAVECDVLGVASLKNRLRRELRSAGISASVIAATRRPDEDLHSTWQRADRAKRINSPRHEHA
jgi:diguanylate cyclase (GGDEF)-like protein